MNTHQFYLKQALKEAQKAAQKEEVPVGVVIVYQDQIIARGHNLKEGRKDCTAHAEIIAIQKAMKKTKDWRLDNCTLYSTLEPCPMCAGAILHARIKAVYFGALDLKWGASGTLLNLFEIPGFNHRLDYAHIPTPECSQILTDFFKKRRATPK